VNIIPWDKVREELEWFGRAAKLAEQSICLRARCAAVIVKNDRVIGAGANGPPQDNPEYRTCLAEYDIPAGFRHDRTCCIHAEQRAIAAALRNGGDLFGARIYFVNIGKQNEKIFATDLKCTICSRAVLDVGITEFALYTVEGVKIYPADEFNWLSYEFKTPKKQEAAS
jgi:deoxycytidylate deaminase